MNDMGGVGSDHCRVVPPAGEASVQQQIQFQRHLFAYMEAARRLPPAARLLEIGTGEGYGAHQLAAHAAEVVATDISWQALQHAARCYPGIGYCITPGTRLPFATDAFDAVVSFQVIEHIPQVEDYLREVWRVLKPGGHFMLTTPNRRWRLLPFQRPWNPYHVREYTARTLQRTLESQFATVQMFGLLATEDIMAWEKARVLQYPAHVYPAMAAGVLRKSIRRVWQHPAKKLLSALTPRPFQRTLPIAQIQAVRLDNFSLSSYPERGLDFFAIVTK